VQVERGHAAKPPPLESAVQNHLERAFELVARGHVGVVAFVTHRHVWEAPALEVQIGVDLGVLNAHRCRHAVAPVVGSLQGRPAGAAARAARSDAAGRTWHGVETGSNLAGV
jgi:hypothetical protein